MHSLHSNKHVYFKCLNYFFLFKPMRVLHEMCKHYSSYIDTVIYWENKRFKTKIEVPSIIPV